jgi:hypothetical protein
MSCGLAGITIADRTYDRRTNDLKGSLTALATGEAMLLVFSHIGSRASSHLLATAWTAANPFGSGARSECA